jgi:S1-C subfamily serine protease
VSDDEATYTVVQSGGKEFEAKVLGKDPNNDIAILKIEGENFPVLPLGDSDAIKVGQTAIAIGNPLGEFANSVSRGIVSGIKRDVTAGSGFGQEERLTNIIQTDAAINPGNSGGPLFDIKGRVIGINVAVAQGAENIGFALPINDVKRIITQVRETGRIVTPYIGVRYALLNEKAAKTLNLPYNYGALILRGQNITDFE